MKKNRGIISKDSKATRVLFFDLVRIVCIIAIVYAHRKFGLIPQINGIFYADGFLPFNIYSAGLQGWAVFGLILVSGAVLELNYPKITGYSQYLTFLIKRVIRIYPAFWLSLIFGLFLNALLLPSAAIGIIANNLSRILFEYTGFYIILGQGQGFINIMGWFIAAIISLYFLFPLVSCYIRKYKLPAIVSLMMVSYITRYLCVTNQNILPEFLWMWFPLCNVFEFGLGIYLVQGSWYPKNSRNYPTVSRIADLSFYVFLFHVIIIQAFTEEAGYGLVFSAYLQGLFQQNPLLGYTVWYLSCTITILLVSYCAMRIDERVQEYLSQNKQIHTLLTQRQ